VTHNNDQGGDNLEDLEEDVHSEGDDGDDRDDSRRDDEFDLCYSDLKYSISQHSLKTGLDSYIQ
jgi:hypothetical protein